MTRPDPSDPAGTLTVMADLTDIETRILTFEQGRWWKYPGAKESMIHEQFGVSATRYYQLLNALLDRPEAMAQDPLTVRRLQRLRDGRRRTRSARRAV